MLGKLERNLTRDLFGDEGFTPALLRLSRVDLVKDGVECVLSVFCHFFSCDGRHRMTGGCVGAVPSI